jgi:F1F0 ATPase subunit 2
MDEQHMSFLSMNSPPSWPLLLRLAAHLAAGMLLGVLYFRSLWWNIRRFIGGGRVTTTIALMVGRFILLGGPLVFASLEGALPLLMLTLGVLIARSSIMRAVGETTP